MVSVSITSGEKIDVSEGASLADVLAGCADGGDVVAARVDGVVRDLSASAPADAQIEWIRQDSAEGLEILRHSTSHIMAEAVGHLYKDVKFAIGPPIANGFYYDFDLDERIGEADLDRIAGEMKKIIKAKGAFERFELPRDQALARMNEDGQIYKTELIEGLPEGEDISFYRHGDFTDLCRGPHLPDTAKARAFKLLSIAGSYWRGDEKKKMLQRIYGTAFYSKEALAEHLHLLEEAKKRDHRRLGRDLKLFSFHEEGPGFAFWHPKGMVLFNALLDYWRRRHRKAGYVEVSTPIMLDEGLWKRSGHWDNYREKMYFSEVEGRTYAVKPMNCPGGLLIYGSDLHSYKEFPMRVAEVGLVHRHEQSGELHGLLRVRQFHQDDAHIFCTPDQIADEVVAVIELVLSMYKDFGFEDVHIELSTRPEKCIGSDEDWEKAESALRAALERAKIDFKLNPGDGAFYGPKIDFHLRDALKRTHQCGTIQVDFAMPRRFDLEYVDSDGARKLPIMIHRTVLGSIERFVGILIEHCAGALPAWLAPVQARVLTVTDAHAQYGSKVVDVLAGRDLRVELDDRNEKIGLKIRQGILEKVPYMLIVGDREVEAGTVAVRSLKDGDLGAKPLEDLAEELVGETRI